MFGDNSKRLTGLHETSSKDTFTYNVGDRTVSCRIPVPVFKAKCGYFEHRVPASDADPYVVTSLIFATICCDRVVFNSLMKSFNP